MEREMAWPALPFWSLPGPIMVDSKHQLLNDDFVIVRQEGLYRERYRMGGFKRLVYTDPNRTNVIHAKPSTYQRDYRELGWVLGIIECEALPAPAPCLSSFISWRSGMC